MARKYILAIDQGTTSSRAIVFDKAGNIRGHGSRAFRQLFPKPGWVEHDPEEIWRSQQFAIRRAIKAAGVVPGQIAAIGVTNQRETTIVWNRKTGEPVHNAIVWQCRRTAPICDRLRRAGMETEIRRKTGLVIDAYFSATKVKWLLDNVPGARKAARKGELCFGTVDTWLIYKLTVGRVHATDVTNASRTMLYNIRKLDWDPTLLEALKIPREMVPQVLPSSAHFGETDRVGSLPAGIPITGVVGDQQAALFGQACFRPGAAKNTYGTGCFVLENTGGKPIASRSGLLTTVAWGIGKKTTYALEGSVFVAGAVVQWLRDELKLIKTARESESLARTVADNGGVFVVPAFVGLGAPHWDIYARGTIVGLTRGTQRGHIVRAALESIAYQAKDVIDCMTKDSKTRVCALRADGGASRNDLLMQFQADVLGVPVERTSIAEVTALGAAFLAGLHVGYWNDQRELEVKAKVDKVFEPSMPPAQRTELHSRWKKAVAAARTMK